MRVGTPTRPGLGPRGLCVAAFPTFGRPFPGCRPFFSTGRAHHPLCSSRLTGNPPASLTGVKATPPTPPCQGGMKKSEERGIHSPLGAFANQREKGITPPLRGSQQGKDGVRSRAGGGTCHRINSPPTESAFAQTARLPRLPLKGGVNSGFSSVEGATPLPPLVRGARKSKTPQKRINSLLEGVVTSCRSERINSPP